MKEFFSKPFPFVILNILGFIALRYLNIFAFFLSGIGSDYEYSFFDYLVVLLIQIGWITFLMIRSKENKKFKYLASIILLFMLYLFGHWSILPHYIVPI